VSRRWATGLVAAVLVAAGCAAGTDRDGAGSAESGEAAASLSDDELRQRAALEPCPEAAAAADGPERLPDVTLPCLGEGPALEPAALGGTPTVVNLWASWCGPCIEELPALQAVHERGGDGLRVVGVLTQDDARQGLAAAEGLGVSFPSGVDRQGSVKAGLGIAPLPATLFVHADGTVAARYVGPALDEAGLTALVREHLGVTL
jgi:cytochrome c biogenesis protein CcmG, thiol:disulfide interchange protein DsbE